MDINVGTSLLPDAQAKHKLLVLDVAWAFEAIRERNLENSVTCRDLGGFFEHVWSVHPFASLVTSEEWASKYGKPEHHQLNTSHTFIEGKIGRFSLLRMLPPLNFILSQVGIFFDLVHLIQKHNITIIRVGDPQYLGLFGWALSRLCKIPFGVRVPANYDKIFETTGQLAFKKLFFNRNVEKIIERFVLKRADLVAAGNQDNLNFALKNGARAEVSTIFRYGNLIDKRHFVHPKDRADGTLILKGLGVERGKFLLYVGRLEEIKQPSHVLYVLADIRKRGNDIKALLVGDGSLRKQLQGLAQELGVEDHVVFCGNRDQGWLCRVIPLSLSVVSPHTGRALVESALGAAPIAAYDVDWQSELIQNSETGELVPNLEWKKMAVAIERYLIDPKYARSMGQAVRKRASKMMDPAKLDQHERETYLDLLGRFREQQVRENIEVHDKVANDYASAHGEIFNEIEQERLSSALKESLQTVKTGCKSLTALDYGCGSGNITNQLLNLNINVVAADVSSHFLTLVRQKFSCERLSTLSLNGKDLIGVEADSFDFIAVYSVLHHIPDYLAAITELARVCKPGGVIYIDHEHNDEYFFDRPVYKEFKSKALRIDWRKYFVFSNYVGKIRRWFNPKYSNEGDIHVWRDDCIEFHRIEEILTRLGFEVVWSKDYLHFNKLYRPEIYKKYEKLCTDVRLMVFRKSLI